MKLGALITVVGFYSIEAISQGIGYKPDQLEPVGVTMSFKKLDGKNTVQVVKDTAVKADDEPTFIKLKGYSFTNGTIEVTVLSKLRENAPPHARGFIGLAFRIDDTNSKFECIYIRPTNGKADDQVRRNHSIQYFSYPDFKFNRLRKEFPEKYESYADMDLNRWIRMKVIVNGAQARLYLNDGKEPVLIVNDLKLGTAQTGSIGLFVDIGTEGYFTDLTIKE